MRKRVLWVLIIFVITIFLTGCGALSSEKRRITNNAIDYFSNKYNINKRKIKIKSNNLYGRDERCLGSCGENRLYINYDDKEFIIEYNSSEDSYGDNYQYDQIYKDFLNYLKTKFNYASEIKVDLLDADVMKTTDKYDGDIKNYLKNVNKVIFDDGTRKGYTRVDVWLEAQNGIVAKELNQKYSKELIRELEDLEINYNIVISTDSGTNEYSSFYDYHVHDSSFYFTDNVDNRKVNCQRNEWEYRIVY